MTEIQEELVKEVFLAVLVALLTVAVNRFYRSRSLGSK